MSHSKEHNCFTTRRRVRYALPWFIGGLILLGGGSQTAQAAEFKLSASPSVIQGRAPVVIEVLLSTERAAINAVAGSLTWPTQFFSLASIADGASIIPFWVEAPMVVAPGIVKFSGLIPGGLTMERGKIFSVTFISTPQAAERGAVAAITLSEAQALLNDGRGTAAPVSVRSATVKILPGGVALITSTEPLAPDSTPPEPFTARLWRDPKFFNGQWTLIFQTQDKQSGVSHYLAQEARPGGLLANSWVKVESPWVLADQSRQSVIYLKAVDRAGNERLVTVPPISKMARYAKYAVWCILGLAGIALIFFVTWYVRARRASPPKT